MDYKDLSYGSSETSDLFEQEPLVYASFWERVGAFIIDILVLLIPSFIVNSFFGYMVIVDLSDGRTFISVASLINILINFLYSALQESGPAQATVGKRALGLKVISTEGARISFGQASGRFFGRYISALIIFIGFFMMLWSDKKQTLHDQMAGTLVVKS